MVRLRALESKDVPFMYEWMQDSDIGAFFMKKMSERTIEDIHSFINNSADPYLSANRDMHLAIVDDEDEYLGTISLKNYNLSVRSAEYAIVVRKKARGTDAALEATRLILKKGFNDLKLHKIYLNVLSTNVRAIKFYEKAGFVFEGELRDHVVIEKGFANVKRYSMLDSEFRLV